ncbi:MAG: carbohydrate binding family 9 domain-containing protein [candidate division Zixibacteria bacterium]|nr:carbohydrate binding family 9 domain-containing protein [candidate division Zixibacteria bacterium]
MKSVFLSEVSTAVVGFLLIILLLAVPSVTAQSDFKPNFHPQLNVTRATGAIKIDGYLDDPGWQGAATADNFQETTPGDNIPPPVETRGFITYDDDNFYIAAVCYADPSEIRAVLSQRDRMGGDNIGFFFDTYGDAAWCYIINVNPFGVQYDAIWTNGYGEDGAIDLVFNSAGQITDSGYQVELAIPFSSLRFPDTEEQTWKMQFWRHHYRETHYVMTWTARDRSESNWVRNWGTITGIKNVSPGRGIEVIPAWTGSLSGALEVAGDSSLKFDNYDPRGEPSVTAKYSISSNITLNATVNPDFSNVETDQFQIDVNSPTALSYPEKRPFFQEGSDLYRTYLNLVYTRSINEPDFAAKMTARMGRTSISFLSAHDVTTPFIIPFEETSSGQLLGGKSFSNILRARRTFGTGSQFGTLITNRYWDGGGSSTNYGADAIISFNRQMTLRAQAVGSYIEEPDNIDLTPGLDGVYFDDNKYSAVFDGESFGGHAIAGSFSYDGRNLYLQASYSERGPTFRADNGWIPRNNRRSIDIYSSYVIHFDRGLLERIEIQVNPMRVWNMDGQKKDEAVFTTLFIPLRFYQTNFTYQNMVSTETFKGIYFGNIWNNYCEFNTSPSELIAFGGSFSYGNQLAYGYPAMGRQTKRVGWVDLNLFDRLYIENWITDIKSSDVDTHQELFDFYVYGSRISFQYNRRLSFRLFTQYHDAYKTWDFDPLITYQITPFALFYVGSTYYIQRYDDLDVSGNRLASSIETQYSHYKLDSRQFFMKLQYLFQL